MATPATVVAPLPSGRAGDVRGLVLVLALAFVGAASFQGSRGLYETTEGRYAETARETMLSGDYDDPVLNNRPHWTKPPLTYIAIIPGLRLLGENPWGVRAYLVVAMVLAAGAIWLAGCSLGGAGAGRWAGIVFATSPYLALVAHSVSTDMLVVLWTALAFAAFWYGHAHRSWKARLGMWVFLSLGVLTKGPPALLVPAVSLPIAWLLLRRVDGWSPGKWISGAGLAIFLFLGLGWYAVEAEIHPGLASYWLGTELIARNISGEMHRNAGMRFVFLAYLPILLLGTGPWLPLALQRARPLKAWWLRTDGRPAGNHAARLSLLAGVAIPFVLFSLSQSKLALYLAPLFVPLSLLLGRMIDLLISQGRLRPRTARGCAGFLLALIVAAKAAASFVDSPEDMTRLAALLSPVLVQDGERALCSVDNQPLNGLEFHLRRAIENVEPAAIRAHMQTTALNGQPTDYLFRKSRWAGLATNAPGPVHVVPLGRYWLLVSPDVRAWQEKLRTP